MTPTIIVVLSIAALVVIGVVAYQLWWKKKYGAPSDWNQRQGSPVPVDFDAFVEAVRALYPSEKPVRFIFKDKPWKLKRPTGETFLAMGQTNTDYRTITLLSFNGGQVMNVRQTAAPHEWAVILYGQDVGDKNPALVKSIADGIFGYMDRYLHH